MFKHLIQKRLELYVKAYFKKHPEVKLIGVTGSVGKTSTKIAIATVLSERFRVRLHDGNYNTHLSAPLAVLGIEYPDNMHDIGAWLTVFKAAKERIEAPTDVDVIVQELGSDRIGQVKHFGTYLRPDIGVISAVSPEHMEFFHTVDNVAKEELGVVNFSKIALINRDDISGEYAKYLTNASVNTYGTSAMSEYHFISNNYSIGVGHEGLFYAPEWQDPIVANINVLGEHTLRPAIAAGAVGIKMGMMPEEIVNGLGKISAVPGRMSVLRGIKNSIIIDDSYNSSPLAADCSLRELYLLLAPQHIAVLGDMNELGDSSQAEHAALGTLCDPEHLDWVVTVGNQAEQFLAPAAKLRGCQVRSFKDAISAGAFVRSVIDDNAAVLFKGSEGGIFLEEAIKVVLHSSADELKLVRQSPKWIARKNAFFSKNAE